MDLCVWCERVVTTRQHALQCDSCNKWQHRLCGTGMTLMEYRQIGLGDTKWLCSICKDNNSEEILHVAAHFVLEDEAGHSPPAASTLSVSGHGDEEPPEIFDVSAVERAAHFVLEDEAGYSPPAASTLSVSGHGDEEPPEIFDVSAVERAAHFVLEDEAGYSPPAASTLSVSGHGDEEPPEIFDVSAVERAAHFVLEDEAGHSPPAASTLSVSGHGDEEPPEIFDVSAVERALQYVSPASPDDPDVLGEDVVLRHHRPGYELEELVPSEAECPVEESWQVIPNGSKMGQPLLVGPGGHTYTIKRRNKTSTNWWCSIRGSQRRCPATIVERDGTFSVGKHEHDHLGKPNALLQKTVRAEVRQKALEKESKMKSGVQLVEEALINYGLAGTEVLPKIDNEARAANRLRAGTRPLHPTSLDFEINLDQVPKDFLVADINKGNCRHLVFASPPQLEILKKAKHIYMDGTFKVVRKPWTQLFSLHAFVKSGEQFYKQVPLMFIIMSGRSKADYIKVLQAVTSLCPDFSPEEVMLDFEAGLWEAVREVFPEARISGCTFHWCQSVFRKIKAVGLQTAYVEHGTLHRAMKKLLALPLLPAMAIPGVLSSLKEKNAGNESLDEVFQYVQQTWLGSLFPVDSWAAFGRVVRTNNDLEGYHHRLNQRVGAANINLHALIEVLAVEAEMVPIHAQLVTSHALSSKARAKTQKHQEELWRLWRAYDKGDLALEDLHSSVTCYLPF